MRRYLLIILQVFNKIILLITFSNLLNEKATAYQKLTMIFESLNINFNIIIYFLINKT